MIVVMGAIDGEDALALAALHVMGEGATAASMAERFAALGAVMERSRMAALLGRLVTLGLVDTHDARHGAVYYIPTVIGQEYTSVSIGGRVDISARLEELEQLRMDLLATVAHELRTPLTAVRTCVGLLLDPGTSPDAAARAQLLQAIERSADR